MGNQAPSKWNVAVYVVVGLLVGVIAVGGLFLFMGGDQPDPQRQVVLSPSGVKPRAQPLEPSLEPMATPAVAAQSATPTVPLAAEQARELAGKVKKIRGKAQAVFKGEVRPLKNGDPVFAGDTLVTEVNSRLILIMSDDAMLALGEKTEFEIKSYHFSTDGKPSEGRMLFKRGFFRAVSGKLAKLENKPFNIETPVASMGVRGTEFAATLTTGADGKPSLEVVSIAPTAVVKNEAGTTLLDKAHTETKVADNKQAPSAQAKVSPAKVASVKLSTAVPRRLTSEAKEAIQNQAAQSYLESGLAKNEAEAQALAEASLSKLVEEASWNATADALLEAAKTEDKILKLDEQMQALEGDLGRDPATLTKLTEVQSQQAQAKAALEQNTTTALADAVGQEKLDEVKEALAQVDAEKSTLDEALSENLSGLDGTALAQVKALDAQQRAEQAALDGQLAEALGEGVNPAQVERLKSVADEIAQQQAAVEQGLEKQLEKLDATEKQALESLNQQLESNQAALQEGLAVQLSSQGFTPEQIAQAQAASQQAKEGASLDGDQVQSSVAGLSALQALSLSQVLNEQAKALKGLENDFSKALSNQLGEGKANQVEKALAEASAQKQALQEKLQEKVTNVVGGEAASQALNAVAQRNDAVAQLEKQTLSKMAETVGEGADVAKVSNLLDQRAERLAQLESKLDKNLADAGVAADAVSKVKDVAQQAQQQSEQLKQQMQQSLEQGGLSADKAAALAQLATLKEQRSTLETPPSLDQLIDQPVAADAKELQRVSEQLVNQMVAKVAEQVASQGGSPLDTIKRIVEQAKTESTPLIAQPTVEPLFKAFEPAQPEVKAEGDQGPPEATDKAEAKDKTETKDMAEVTDKAESKDKDQVDNQQQATEPDNATKKESASAAVAGGGGSNKRPTALYLSASSVSAGAAAGTVVGKLSAVDPDGDTQLVYTLVSPYKGADGAFTISGDQLVVASNSLLNQNKSANGEKKITVRVTDTAGKGQYLDKSFTIVVSGMSNFAPTAIHLSNTTIPANSSVGTVIGSLVTSDPDVVDQHSYSFATPNMDASGRVGLEGNTLVVKTPSAIVGGGSYSITLRATDAGGLSTVQDFVLTAAQVENKAPTVLLLSGQTIQEDRPVGSVIGALSGEDPEGDTLNYSFGQPYGDAGGLFGLDGNLLQVKQSPLVIGNYKVTLNATDSGGLVYSETFVITVTEVNKAPTDLMLSNSSVDANSPAGRTVGGLSVIDPNTFQDNFVYSFAPPNGDAEGRFDLVGNTLVVKDAAALVAGSYPITLRVTDLGGTGLSFDKSFTIVANAVNHPPTDLYLTSEVIPLNSANGTAIATVIGVDADQDEQLLYSFDAPHSHGGGRFSLVGDQLVVADSAAIIPGESYTITVKVTDHNGAGYSLSKDFTLLASTDPNRAPTDLFLSHQSLSEYAQNGSIVGQLSAQDPDGDTDLVYSFANPDSNAGGLFALDGANLVVADQTLLNPGVKAIVIRVTDKAGAGLSFEKSFQIEVTSTNQAPTDLALSSSVVPLNSVNGALIGQFTPTDSEPTDSFVYSFTAPDADALGRFSIEGNQLVLLDAARVVAGESYPITVRVTDRNGTGLSLDKGFVIQASTDPNRAPTDIQLSALTVGAGSTPGTVVATLTATDPDGDTDLVFAFADPNGNGGGRFALNGSQLAVLDGTLLTAGSYPITLRVTDKAGAGLSFEKSFQIEAVVVNEAPTALQLSSNVVPLGSVQGDLVGVLTATDPNVGDSFTYSFTTPNGNASGLFQLNGDRLEVADGTAIVAGSSYAITVQVSDQGGLSLAQDFTILASTDSNRAPTDIMLSAQSIPAQSADGSEVAQLTATDPDGDTDLVFAFADPNGNGGGRFALNGDRLLVADSTLLTAGSYDITLRVTDKGGDGLSYDETLSITVTPINQAPTDMTLSSTSVASDSVNGTVVGMLTTTDPDGEDGFVYSFAEPNLDANGRFALNGANLVVADAARLVPTTGTAEYPITIRVTDKEGTGLSLDKSFTIVVSMVNHAPTDIFLNKDSVLAGSPTDQVVGSFSASDPDGDTDFVYALVEPNGDAGGRFGISGSNLVVADSTKLDVGNHLITVRVTDQLGAGLSFDKSFTIIVSQGNQAPTALVLSNNQVAYTATSGTVVGSFSATDPDTDESFVYSFTEPGLDAGGRFSIVGDTLQVADAQLLNTFTSSSRQHAITVKVTDQNGAGLSFTQSFSINVTRLTDTSSVPVVGGTSSSIAQTAKTSFTSVESALQAGGAVTLSEADITALVLGKMAQQMTPGGAFTGELSDVIKKFTLSVSGDEVVATAVIGSLQSVYDRLPEAAKTVSDTLFGSVAAYSATDTASVRIRMKPIVSGTTVSFDAANSYVDVVNESTLLPNLTFGLSDLINEYNVALAKLQTGGLSFFTGASDGNGSQQLSSSISVNTFFPGLVDTLSIESGAITLTPPVPATNP
ncbi:Cadherin [Magnetococcus marinus MC-1]|uniref:Cadherin n=1 Tax=Magnetococcus marinus (strain ATCC BAA-1437 / JCM 17883 / MC-1) TaxID=156889 RepID=A0LCQ5_MAGMM|nr:FecR domain-containing protein [Magnetococcus marinus]ABK45748.1 Cadherin [Magnetococcus marinus MC-1]